MLCYTYSSIWIRKQPLNCLRNWITAGNAFQGYLNSLGKSYWAIQNTLILMNDSKIFFLKIHIVFLSIRINFWRAEKFPMLAYWYIFFYFCNFYSANMLAYQYLTIVIYFFINLVKSFKWLIFWCFSIIYWNDLLLVLFF